MPSGRMATAPLSPCSLAVGVWTHSGSVLLASGAHGTIRRDKPGQWTLFPGPSAL